TLGGSGSISGPVTGSGQISPGGSGPGRFTVNGNFALTSGGSLAADLNGTTAATFYDQLRVSGTVTLGGTLTLSVGYTPAVGDFYTVIDNTGASAVSGTFTGLVEGALVRAFGRTFRISYVGGTGNDVVLT